MLRTLAFAIALCAVVLAVDTPTPSLAGDPELQGDANCSGTVDTVDALTILRQGAGLANAPCQHLADVQCDADIDAIDALQVLRWGAALPVSQQPGCTQIGQPIGPPPSSYDLIEDAVESGQLDEETGLVYKFYAAFNDPRLPEEYQGDDSSVHELPLRSEVAAIWPGLSQQARDLILPFMRTPAEPDSWYSQTASRMSGAGITWQNAASTAHPVKVWWETRFPGDEPRANAFVAALDTSIWQKLTGLMGTEPLPDCGAACPSGGGDPRLDIYLVGPSVDANYTWWNPPDAVTCETTPTYITLRPDASPATLAHEFMHALQFALPYANGDGCSDDFWWESTATWAEDYVYRAQYNDEQHPWAQLYLQFPHLSLDSEFLKKHYGAYLFPFYLDRVRGKPELVQQVFSRMGSEPDALKAIESVVSGALGDFAEVWKDFTLKNWNRDPVTDYKDLDSLMSGARPREQQVRVGDTELQVDIIEYLGATYEKLTFSNDVHTVVFKNTLAGVEHAGVMALKKIDGEWKDPEDWSDDAEKEFCLDRPSEKLTELVIILSNSDAIGRNRLNPSSPPTIEGKRDGCSGWEGSVSVEGTSPVGQPGRATYVAASHGIVFEQTYSHTWELTAGRLHWTASGTPLFCDGTLSGELEYDFASQYGQDWFDGRFVIDLEDPSIYSVYITGSDPDAMEVWDCDPPNEGFSGEHPWWTGLTIIPNRDEGRDLPLTGKAPSRVAAGEMTLGPYSGFDSVTYRWSFTEYGTGE